MTNPDNTPPATADLATGAASAPSVQPTPKPGPRPSASVEAPKSETEALGAAMPEGYSPEPAGELHAPSAEFPHSHDEQVCSVCMDPEQTHDQDGDAVDVEKADDEL